MELPLPRTVLQCHGSKLEQAGGGIERLQMCIKLFINTCIVLGICYELKSNNLLVAGGSHKPGQSEIYQYCSSTGHLISYLAYGLFVPCAMTTTHDNQLSN